MTIEYIKIAMNNEMWNYVILAAAAFIVYQLFISKETLENVVEATTQAVQETTQAVQQATQAAVEATQAALQTTPTVLETTPTVLETTPAAEAVAYKGKVNSQEAVKLSAPLPEVQQKQLEAEDLLPKYSEADAFAKENPVSKLLKEQNFLIAGYHTGVNTVMQSNKIPYHDLRSAPPIAKQDVGPWMQSSYEQPAGGPGSRRFFEVGQW